ncbi:arginine utilization regulatory protein [Alteribacillus persepolensis]|uniref:Arginine utilization regulatory protein n=1 Tax=Alteribacillus persepolensis TaxID=568899 RepID=A0A1G8F491_9BACI|nr:sigma 54-interacting transcriptional regulator [Alteribacillus persepolensis]SDH76907.1 arginine utilization regulatory protein [Alteribacillus persepolensis]
MHIDVDTIEQLADYDNILVVDKNGFIMFYDTADLNVLMQLGVRPEEFMGKRVTELYKDLNEENSTVMQVLSSGVPLIHVKQEMTTKKGDTVFSISSTYPVKEDGQIVAAIEFSTRSFTKENIHHLDQFAKHKVYRKNNTIYTIDDIVTEHPKMKKIKEKLRNISRTNSTVLLYGRTGTGKEVVAQSIHNLSSRYAQPFISFNCSSVPPNLLESTLFGTKKGGFTGAEDRPGLFEQADGGTLFLDEINSLDMPLQVKLLKAIEEKTIRRIGGKSNISLDIRVISATNEDPDKLVQEKKLREDLFYRLSVVQLNLPDLAERKEDIEILVASYIRFYNHHMNTYVDSIQPEVLECFKNYHWPGNVRELKNAIETAYNHVSSHEITMDDIPDRMKQQQAPSTASAKRTTNVTSIKEAVEEYEKSIIVETLEKCGGVIAETARQLRISKQSLKYKMDKYELR